MTSAFPLPPPGFLRLLQQQLLQILLHNKMCPRTTVLNPAKEMIALLQRARQPFNVNAIAQAAALGALQDDHWVTQCRKRNTDGLEQLANGLKALDIEYLPSQANFILSKPGDGRGLFTELQKQGIITRALGPSLAPYLRLSVGTEEENHRLLTALEKTRTVFGA